MRLPKIPRSWKRPIHLAGFEFHLLKKIQNLTRYWKSGEVNKGPVPFGAVKTLVLAPHPDDETIGCGATLAELKSRGARIDVVYLTRGELGRAPESRFSHETSEEFSLRREREARAAGAVLGIDSHWFWRGSDGQLSATNEIVEKLTALLDGGQYQLVFCPWPHDLHSDHVATFEILRKACSLLVSPIPHVLFYEVWSPVYVNRVITVDSSIETKLAAVGCYESQLEGNDLITKIRGLAQYRSIYVPKSNYCEAFFEVSGDMVPLLP